MEHYSSSEEALTTTGMQEVVTNLMVTKIEVREERHPDVVKHVHPKHVQVVRVPLETGEIAAARQFLLNILRQVIVKLISVKVLFLHCEAVLIIKLAQACLFPCSLPLLISRFHAHYLCWLAVFQSEIVSRGLAIAWHFFKKAVSSFFGSPSLRQARPIYGICRNLEVISNEEIKEKSAVVLPIEPWDLLCYGGIRRYTTVIPVFWLLILYLTIKRDWIQATSRNASRFTDICNSDLWNARYLS